MVDYVRIGREIRTFPAQIGAFPVLTAIIPVQVLRAF